MDTVLLTLLTLAVGTAVGLIFFRIKIPGGLIVGSIIGTAILGLGFEAAYIPNFARTVAQIVAGAFIGSSVGPNDLRRLPTILKPYLILIAGYLVLDMVVGFAFIAVSHNAAQQICDRYIGNINIHCAIYRRIETAAAKNGGNRAAGDFNGYIARYSRSRIALIVILP